MSKHNSYDPEHERTCRGCQKKLKTKDGILEGKYKFSCPPCHQWYKNATILGKGVGIGVSLIIVGLLIYLIKQNKKINLNVED